MIIKPFASSDRSYRPYMLEVTYEHLGGNRPINMYFEKNLFKRHNENQYEKMLIPTIHDYRQYVQFHQTLLPSCVKIKVKQIKNK